MPNTVLPRFLLVVLLLIVCYQTTRTNAFLPFLPLPTRGRSEYPQTQHLLGAEVQEYAFQLDFQVSGDPTANDLPSRLTDKEEEGFLVKMEKRLSLQFNRTIVLDRESDGYLQQLFNVDVKGGFFANFQKDGILRVRDKRNPLDDLVVTLTPKWTGQLHFFNVTCIGSHRITAGQAYRNGLVMQPSWTTDGSSSLIWKRNNTPEEGIFMTPFKPALEWRLLAPGLKLLFWTLKPQRHYYEYLVVVNGGDTDPSNALYVTTGSRGSGYFCGWKHNNIDGGGNKKSSAILIVEGPPKEVISILFFSKCQNLHLKSVQVTCQFPMAGRCAGLQTSIISRNYQTYNRTADEFLFDCSFVSSVDALMNKKQQETITVGYDDDDDDDDGFVIDAYQKILSWNTRVEDVGLRDDLRRAEFKSSYLDVVD